MRLLLDHDVPAQLRRALPDHDVVLPKELGRENLKNGALLRAADGEFDILITADKTVRFQQSLSALTRLRAPQLSERFITPATVLALVPEIERELVTLADRETGALGTVGDPLRARRRTADDDRDREQPRRDR